VWEISLLKQKRYLLFQGERGRIRNKRVSEGEGAYFLFQNSIKTALTKQKSNSIKIEKCQVEPKPHSRQD
jgi:hypothetical protein